MTSTANEDMTKPETTEENAGQEGSLDLSSLRLPQNYAQMAGVKKILTTAPVRKPGRQEFIRVHPESPYRLETMVLEFKGEGETYLVNQPLWPALANELIAKILYLTITRQGDICIWPIRLPDEEGKIDNWNRSAHEAVPIAMTKWVRVSSNRSLGAYEVWEAQGDLGEPEWPDLSFDAILEIAFKDRFIDSLNHPALKRLRGEM